MVATVLALNIGYFTSSLYLLGTLDNLIIELTYLSHVSAAFFNSTDTEMATIVHRARGNHPKFFVA